VINEKLPDITDFARNYLGVEPITEPVPIQPTAHYAMGGIPTDVEARVVIDPQLTPMPGFYAAGEVACISVHGANRLGTNSLVDAIELGSLLVFAVVICLGPLEGLVRVGWHYGIDSFKRDDEIWFKLMLAYLLTKAHDVLLDYMPV